MSRLREAQARWRARRPRHLPWLRRSVAALTFGAMTACGGPSLVWYRPDANQTDWIQDRYACERDTRMSAASFGGTMMRDIHAQQFFARCLQAKGYTQIPAER